MIKELIEQGFKTSYIAPHQIKDKRCLEHHISVQTIATINHSVAAEIFSMYPITSFHSKLFFRQTIHSKTSSIYYLYICHSSSFTFRVCYEKIKTEVICLPFLNGPMQLDDKSKSLKLLQIYSIRPNQNLKMKGDSNSSMHLFSETNHSNRSFLNIKQRGYRCKFSISRLPQNPVIFDPDNHRFTTTYKRKQNKRIKISTNKIENDNPNVVTSHSKFEIVFSEHIKADKTGNKAYHPQI